MKEKPILHHISIQELLSEIDQIYDLSPIQRDGFFDCLCPIHKTSDFRTLTLHVKEQNFRCSFPQCKGFMGGSLIDLFAWTLDCTREEAMNYWIKKMQGIPVSLRAFALGLPKGSPANTNRKEMDKSAFPIPLL